MGGSGKSVFLRFLIWMYWAGLPAWWVFDPMHQHSILTLLPNVHVVHDVRNLSYSRCVLQPMGDIDKQFNQFCLVAYKHQNLPVAIEETQKFSSPHKISKEFRDLQSAGRNRGVTYICITRHPKRIHPDIYSDSHHLVTFRLHLPSEVKYLSEWFGEGVEQIKTAPPYHYVYKYHEDLEPTLCAPAQKAI